MAEKETKAVKAPKKEKSNKPSLFSRIAAWFRSCKAEMKKITWATWSNVKTNTIMVLITIIVLSAVIGLVDFIFSQGIVILGILIK